MIFSFVHRTGPLLQTIIAGRMPEKIGRRSLQGGHLKKVWFFKLFLKIIFIFKLDELYFSLHLNKCGKFKF